MAVMNLFAEQLGSFHPETGLFRHGGVNLRTCLCGVLMYASAQSLDFLAITKNCSFPNRKLNSFSSGVSGWNLGML
jgi:hypothetical protein